MVLRIAFSIALLGTVFFGVGYLRTIWQIETLQSDLELSYSKVQQQQATLTDVEEQNRGLQEQLIDMDADLGATKTRLTATETIKVQQSRAINELHQQLRDAETRISHLMVDIATLRASLIDAKAHRASVESVVALNKTIAELEKELATLEAKLAKRPTPPPQPTGILLTTNRSRSAIVVTVGPSNAFVVVNYGANHGALPSQIMTIKRGTSILASALISDVRENHSIAQIQPESLRGALHKGDSAVLAQ